jgi:hypothetical protein
MINSAASRAWRHAVGTQLERVLVQNAARVGLVHGSSAMPNVRAKLAPAVGRAGQVGENVQGTADLARVARRWGST